ncbi:MAG: ferredoxin [Ilumatobacteraceae bacterium]|jgi:ferredoxin|nr:ferredoxin [Actinomycetota bacterium]MDA3009507.1 ferredoxin [Actinomycetota bacterium]
MALEVWVDGDECVSAGKCVAATNGFFEFDENEVARVGSGDRPDDELLIRIARLCPNGAIHLRDGDVELEL